MGVIIVDENGFIHREGTVMEPRKIDEDVVPSHHRNPSPFACEQLREAIKQLREEKKVVSGQRINNGTFTRVPDEHKCNPPNPGIYSIPRQTIWKCDCGKKYKYVSGGWITISFDK